MEEECKCPYYDAIGKTESKEPVCHCQGKCDYPFYCPIKESKE